uniref:Uncharacterized protein n=1 Tax=Plectus sambesii TaxID=2011161 RepID=A0A914WQ35_9BILA
MDEIDRWDSGGANKNSNSNGRDFGGARRKNSFEDGNGGNGRYRDEAPAGRKEQNFEFPTEDDDEDAGRRRRRRSDSPELGIPERRPTPEDDGFGDFVDARQPKSKATVDFHPPEPRPALVVDLLSLDLDQSHSSSAAPPDPFGASSAIKPGPPSAGLDGGGFANFSAFEQPSSTTNMPSSNPSTASFVSNDDAFTGFAQFDTAPAAAFDSMSSFTAAPVSSQPAFSQPAFPVANNWPAPSPSPMQPMMATHAAPMMGYGAHPQMQMPMVQPMAQPQLQQQQSWPNPFASSAPMATMNQTP